MIKFRGQLKIFKLEHSIKEKNEIIITEFLSEYIRVAATITPIRQLNRKN